MDQISHLRFGVLGPVTVLRDGADTPVTAAMPRALLTALLLGANRPVSVERLVAGLWGEAPPRNASASLHNHVHRLRRHLGPGGRERLRGTSAGYVLEIRDGELDLPVFAELHERGRRARQARDWEGVVEALSAMLALWRGEPASDVDHPVLEEMERERLREMRVQALDWRAEAELRLGRHAEVIADLRAAVAAHPLAEMFAVHLMLALHRSGRDTEALEVFRQTRAVLREELGVSPGPVLTDVNRGILERDPRLGWSAAVPGAVAAPRGSMSGSGGRSGRATAQPADQPADLPSGQATDPPSGSPSEPLSKPPSKPRTAGPPPGVRVPRTLPADAVDVVGRDAETRQLIGWLTQASGAGPGAVRVTAIGGMAGVGTSALAIHVAWRVSDRFFDGHLFAQLRGTSRRPVSPHDVLAVFLRQLGIASGAVPADPGERSALFRTLAADRRLLLVLDDARDAAQVAPLVPGGAGCAVVVTHRRQLAGLPGCRHVELDPLSAEASRRMLDRLVGRARLAAEPGATGALVAACAGLPLALRVVAERLVARPDWRIEDLARRFRPRSRHSGAPSGTVLDELGTDGFSVRAGFEAGYVALARPLVGPGQTGAGSASPVPTPAQRAFRLLGEWNGVEIASTEAASLLALPLEEAERLLENLADVRLVRSWRPGRYLLHPLVKEFAGELRAVGPASPPRPVAVGEETR